LWILDVTLSSSMPWYIGSIASISVAVTSKVVPSGKQLNLVLRVVSAEGTELASKFLGVISEVSQEIRGDLQLVISPLNYNASTGTTSRHNLRVVLEGYIGSRVFNTVMDFPVLITSPSSRISLSLSINGRPDYNYVVESIARVNISILLRNTGMSYIDSVLLTLYMNGTLVDRVYIGKVGPLELRELPISLLNYFRAGIYYIRVVATYYLQEGVVEEVTALGLLEVVKPSSVVLTVDRSVVVEGTQVTFSGTITPPPKAGQIVLEKLVEGLWVSVGVASIDPQGSFSFRWVAEDVPIDRDYVVHTFRVRVPLSLVGGVASLYSSNVVVQVFSLKTAAKFITDISLDVVPDTVISGSGASFYVRLRPQIPLCVPVKLAYRDPVLYEWAELGEVVVCGGEGVGELTIRLPPGKYPVKAGIYSKLDRVESLPKVLTVVAAPKLLVEARKTLFYGENLEVKVVVEPAPDTVIQGQLTALINGSQLLSREFSIKDGYATVSLGKVTTVGVINITVSTSVYGTALRNSTLVSVVRPSIAISPTTATVEVGTQISFTIAISPGRVYPVKVTVLQNSAVISSHSVETDELGVAKLTISSPAKPGKYTVVAELQDTQISTSAVLNVIEVVRSLSLELLNKTVEPSATAVARISVHPPPVTPVQVVLLIQVNGRWEPVAYGIIAGSESTLRFQAPSTEGRYNIKASIEGAQIESNVDTLQVSTRLLIAQEYLYTLVALAVAVGGIILLIGRRR